MNKILLRPLLTLVAVLLGATTLWGYAFLQPVVRWADGNIVMHGQLGSSGTLLDGTTSWNAAFEAGLAIWNSNLTRVQFTVVRDSSSPIGDGNRVNNVFFSDTIFGRNFDQNTLAVTTIWSITSTGARTEADIVFNTAQSWNSYRGNLRTASSGGGLNDIRRVGMHEAGHVLGLDHPDDYGQNVVALMHSSVTNLDTLATDDVQGAQALYPSGGDGGGGTGGGAAGAIINFPPRNESLDFRNQLEVKYRDGLRRGGSPTSVDIEGDVVWTQEYLRFRVNQCSHANAIARTMTEIDGGSIGVCGTAPGGEVNFPPRNESLDFRNQLELKYRDGLRRPATSTAVDNEGDVVWTQEYLRYRVNGCTHGDAVQKVFLQIDGRGIQPLCR